MKGKNRQQLGYYNNLITFVLAGCEKIVLVCTAKIVLFSISAINNYIFTVKITHLNNKNYEKTHGITAKTSFMNNYDITRAWHFCF